MTFDLQPYTIVKSVAQRGILKWWSDPQRKGRLPARGDCDAEQLAALWPDMALYRIENDNDRLRYKCLSHGAQLHPFDGADLTGRYFDEFFPAAIRNSALAAHDATVTMVCPIYTQRNAIDADKVPVVFERIRVPLSDSGERIDHLLSHVEVFCEDGGYQRENLLRAGLQMQEYAVMAAISMEAVGLSPGAQIVDT